MQLLPNLTQTSNSEQQQLKSKTYAVDFDQGKVRGFADKRDAMQQAVYKRLQTWQFAHDVYDSRYGFEAQGLIGYEEGYVKSELKRRIKETLLKDDRILEVGSFTFQRGEQDDVLHTRFSVRTCFGVFTLTYLPSDAL